MTDTLELAGCALSRYFDHLSPSNVNDFIERRSKWLASRILRHSFPASVKMHLGTAGETGIKAGTADMQSEADAVALALETFDGLTVEFSDADKAECRANLPRVVAAGIAAVSALTKEYGPVVQAQRRVEGTLPAGLLPWLGFTDLTLMDGTIIDLKVTGTSKSQMPGGWARQGAFYQWMEGAPRVLFLAVVPLKKEVKTQVLPLENTGIWLRQLQMAEHAMEALLSLPSTDSITAACYPNPEDFYWSDEASVEIRKSIWGC
ncbi:hypothetical protein [Azospirillum sp.]|uniref:hypothetical protein n=1 Tax=Azospirillum sp. TaxID=34012 RepID=UPI003D75A90F